MAKRKRENGTSSDNNVKAKIEESKVGKKLIINAFVEMCKSANAAHVLICNTKIYDLI